ncbi:MAG TPA: DUF2339 domain-containing protein [Gaiellaceae bacterium]|nr:DUF2339 domain-containing protein [Gaiellaceae bacterium]
MPRAPAAQPGPPEPPTAPVAPPEAKRRDIDLEELLGGRLLAWVGGLAILVGIVFFVAMAVRRGWIGEEMRVVLAFLGSGALVGVGLYLFIHQGRTQASLAAVASGLAGLYASDVAATRLYDLVSPVVGLACAGLIGALGTAIAIRWRTELVGAIGILGALASPILVQAETSGATLAFMAIALVAAVGVLLWQRWDWLAAGAFVLSAPQLAVWLEDTYEDRLGLALAVLTMFWVLYVVAAIGYELRVPVSTLRASSAMLLLANALLFAGGGWVMLHDSEHENGATAWVVGAAAAHVLLGGFGFRRRMSREIAALVAAVGIGLSAVAVGLALDGPALVIGWSVQAAVLAWVASATRERRAVVGTVAFLALAAGHILTIEAEPDSLYRGVDDLAKAAVALLAFAVSAFVSARLVPDDVPGVVRPGVGLRPVLEAAGAVALVYLGSVAIVDLTREAETAAEPGQTPQVLLSAYWALLGFGSLLFGLLRDDRRFRIAGFGLLAAAIAKVFLFDLSTLESIYRVLSFIALGLLLLAAAFAYQRIRARIVEEAP